jgi:L-ascorbate metabolism protein UlaG (beta-lactamase superfamily)
MVITFYGEGCFKIQSGELTILTDSFDSKIGLTAPRFKPDIVLKTLTPIPIAQPLAPDIQYLVHGPGEYNFQNINIAGFALMKESTENFLKTIYLIEVEGVKLCFFGHLSEMPEPAILEHLEEIDILFVPAGGKPFLDQKSVVKLIRQINPKIVIPAFFKIPGLKRPAADLKVFFEEFNHKFEIEPQEKLSIKKKDLSGIKSSQLIVLKV